MKYRVENIFIPEHGGIAYPGESSDKSQDLKGRRIINVVSVTPDNSGVRARVLTEETD